MKAAALLDEEAFIGVKVALIYLLIAGFVAGLELLFDSRPLIVISAVGGLIALATTTIWWKLRIRKLWHDEHP